MSPEAQGDPDFTRGVFWNLSEMMALDKPEKSNVEMQEDIAKKIVDNLIVSNEQKVTPSPMTPAATPVSIRRLLRVRKAEHQKIYDRKLTIMSNTSLDLLNTKITKDGYTLSMFNASPTLSSVLMTNIWEKGNKNMAYKYITKSNGFLVTSFLCMVFLFTVNSLQ